MELKRDGYFYYLECGLRALAFQFFLSFNQISLSYEYANRTIPELPGISKKRIIMIKGIHTMFYSSQATELRNFLRDKLDFNATDIGDGWLIFDFSEGDMGVHPSDDTGKEGAPSGTHDISFYCDDIKETVEELKSKGVEFKGEIEDHGYGFVTFFKVPGDFYLQLYQPKYK